MSENRKQGNAQIPREAIQGAAGEGAAFEFGVAAMIKDKEGKMVITNMSNTKEPFKELNALAPDFSKIKALDGGLKETLRKGSKEKSERE